MHPAAGPPSRSVFAEAGFAAVEFCEATADPRVVLSVLTVDDGAVSHDASVELIDRLEAAGARVHAERAKGDAHRAVLAEAATGYDLVALGTRGGSGLERLRLGSTASAVVRHAPCSVLVAQADDG